MIYNKELHTKTSLVYTDHMIIIKQMLGPRIRSLLSSNVNFSTVSTHVHCRTLVGRIASPHQEILSFWRSSTSPGWRWNATWLGICKSSTVLCWSSNEILRIVHKLVWWQYMEITGSECSSDMAGLKSINVQVLITECQIQNEIFYHGFW